MWCAEKSFFDSVDPNGAFLACRWHELFDRYTPDTFHPKLFGLADLINEAVEIGCLHKNHEAWAKHLRHVRAEIGEHLERGLERTFCSPRHLSILAEIAKTEGPSELTSFGRILQLEGFSGSLHRAVTAKLAEFDPASVCNKKSEADEAMIAFATNALRVGCTQDDFGDVQKRILAGPDAVKRAILESIPPQESDFDCIVAVILQGEVSASTIRSICRHAGVERTSPKIPGLPQSEDATIFLRRSTKGLRPFDAVEKLRSEVRQSLNLLALYQQAQASAIDSRGWVLSGDGAQEVQDRTAPLQNLHPRRDASSLADKAASALKSREEPAIRAALELHSVALSSVDHRLRLVNLWSAMECLASLVEGETIISRVQKLVVPILAWRKIDKVVRYLAISIHFWLQKNPGIDRSTFPIRLGYNDSVPPEQLLTLLAEPKNSKNILALLNLVRGHPLLLYRIDRAWRTFHSPPVLHSNLNRSAQRLEWHLWRIYRARNLLVHLGREPRCIPQLANHLQQYFSWTLSRILHGLTFGSEWRAADSWTFWKSKSDHVLISLKTNPKTLVVGDMFPEELPASHFPIWTGGHG